MKRVLLSVILLAGAQGVMAAGPGSAPPGGPGHPVTGPSSPPVLVLGTDPVPMPETLPATIPATVPRTMPATIPLTIPATVPATAPRTLPATAPVTIPATNPATIPATAPSTATAPATTSAALFNVPATRVAPPSEAKLAVAAKDVHDAYADYYSKTSPMDKEDLARRLFAAGVAVKLEPQYRYYLLREAAELAAGAGNLGVAMDAVEALAAAFIVDERKLRAQYLEVALRNANAQPHLTLSAARQYVLLADAALDADAFAEAERYAVRAATLAGEARDTPTIRRAAQRLGSARMGAADAEKVAAARTTLAKNPDDQLANLTEGRFLCFVRRDFTLGVPMLAHGFDPELKAAAARELKAGSDADELSATAELWWDIAAALPKTDAMQGILRGHVHSLYMRAIPKLDGLAKALAEKRATDIEADGDANETLTILHATFGGPPGPPADVTSVVSKMFHHDSAALIHVIGAIFSDAPPGPGRVLTITYTYHDREFTDKVLEGTVVMYPPVSREGIAVPTGDFRIVEAWWGRAATWMDVTARVRQQVRGPAAVFQPAKQLVGFDPAPQLGKIFVVTYESGGRRYCRWINQVDSITFTGK